MTAILFRRVRVLDLTLPEGATGECDVLIDGGLVRKIGAGAASAAPAGTRIVDGAGHHLLAPGLINAHFHSTANHMKGGMPSRPLETFMLYESPEIPEVRPSSPREAYLRTMLGAIEMLRGGTTSVQDDAFFVPEPEPDMVDAVMQAYVDAGIRATVAIDQPELPDRDKLPFLFEDAPAWLRPRLESRPRVGRTEMAALNRHLFEVWHGREGGRIRAAVSVSAPQRVSDEYFGDLWELSRRYDTPLFAHMLETKVQRVLPQTSARFGGRSLVRYAHDLGVLDERTNVIHAVWVDDDDIELLAESGATVAHNPISNLRLGSGVMPFGRLDAAGVPIALGSDEAICDDAIDLWAVMKAAGLLHNITGAPAERWPDARRVLRAMFEGGARAMGQADQLGSVREGAVADLNLIDLHTLPFTPLNDIPGQLVYCEQGRSVRMTLVGGDVVVEDGALTRVDEHALLAETRELYASRAGAWGATEAHAARLLPHYAAMVDKAASIDVGFSRWIQN